MSKKMKALLAVLVCLLVVLAAGGYFAWQQGMFDEPVQSDNRWTIRNLTIDAGEEEITLAPEARLRAVKDEGKTALEFEIASGEKILLPVRGEISVEGVNFSLGSSERVYSVNEELLTGLLEMSEADADIIESIRGFVQNYVDLLKLSMDGDFIRENAGVYERMYEIMLNATAEDAKIEVDGKKYNAKTYKGAMTDESMIALLEYMRTCEIEEIAGMMDALLDFISMASGQELDDYGDMMAVIGETGGAIDADVELTVVMNKKMNYQKMTMKQDGGETGMAIDTTAESISTPKGTTMIMRQAMGDPETNGTVMTMDMEITGPQTAPTAVRMNVGYDSQMDYSSEDYANGMSMGMVMTLEGAETDGLWNMTMDTDVTTDYVYGMPGETDGYSETIALNGSYAETAEEDGSVTGAFELKLGYEDMDYGLSFELNRGKDAVVTSLPAGETHALTADMESDAYVYLAEDAMSLLEDVQALAADESVQQLVEMFTIPEIEEPIDGEYTYDESIEQVYSFEEAAAIYTGAIPDYTAPEGYELECINVSEYALEAVYAGGEKRFTYSLMDFGMDLGMGSEVSYTDDGAGNVYYAELFVDTSYVMFNFENALPQAEAEAIVAGLKL